MAKVTVTGDALTDPVVVAPGLFVPRTVTVETAHEGLDVRLVAVAEQMTEGRAGRYVCQELTVARRDGGQPVTGEGLRSIPVAALLRQAVASHVSTSKPAGDGVWEVFDARVDDNDVERVRAAGPTDESLQLVARVYRMALVLGDPPTQAVERTFELARSTAGRWISMARERGLLGGAEGQGRAGG